MRMMTLKISEKISGFYNRGGCGKKIYTFIFKITYKGKRHKRDVRE